MADDDLAAMRRPAAPGAKAGTAAANPVSRWAAAHAETVLTPGAGPGSGSAQAPAAQRPRRTDDPSPTSGPRGRLRLPPIEVTPAFSDAEVIQDAADDEDDAADILWMSTYVASVTTADGRILVATCLNRHDIGGGGYQDEGRVYVWDLETGRRLSELAGHTDHVVAIAWGETLDGRPLLATASIDRTIRIWDADTGGTLQVLNVGGIPRSIPWARASDGRSLLAAADGSNSLPVWDTDTGTLLRRIDIESDRTYDATWLHTADGRLLLTPATRPLRLWDPDTGQCVEILTWLVDSVYSSAWTWTADGRPFLATAGGGYSGTQIYNADVGVHLHTIDPGGATSSKVWAETTDGRLLLATASEDETARIWDAQTGTELASIMAVGYGRDVSWVRDRHGNLLLLTIDQAERTPFHAWLVEEVMPTIPASTDSPGTSPDAVHSLLRLGSGGWWPPLGLLADLITVTGPDLMSSLSPLGAPPGPTALHDPHVAALADDPGIARLRDLAAREPRWTPEARAAFAALLASAITVPDRYAPPAGTAPAELRDALSHALASPRAAMTGAAAEPLRPSSAPAGADGEAAWRTPVAGLRAAAAGITDQMVTLLSVLGPGACAADPLLPVRLAHRVPQLPALSLRELQVLTASRGIRSDGAAAAGALAWSPGVAGLARTGPLTRLLATQLALPRDLMAARLTGNQLLYREHRAPVPAAPEPVTIILDTTPPTFGPAGNALRLAAHLITTTLWAHGRHPRLITLDDPGTVTELRGPTDLIGLWASRTLRDPLTALATAVTTAAAGRRPVVLCTHHHTARAGYSPGPASRLLTVHQPPEAAPGPPRSTWHAHLPPGPTQGELAHAIAAVLVNAEDSRGDRALPLR